MIIESVSGKFVCIDIINQMIFQQMKYEFMKMLYICIVDVFEIDCILMCKIKCKFRYVNIIQIIKLVDGVVVCLQVVCM